MAKPIPVLLEGTLEKAMNRATVLTLLTDMSPEERLAVFSSFCTHCGSGDPKCTCMRDE